MADWLLYTIVGAAVVLVLLLVVLMLKGKIVIGEIELGWPPTIKLVPKTGASADLGSHNQIRTADAAKVAGVEFESKLPGLSIDARGTSEVSQI
ncbi:hypothetical protein, partial [Candidatus Oscillochloris fontis]|uniref:hypothetical protein n=1 Tax=Candidatus Oscillochloris fontis TaxID=2496868 RepID=UPI001291A7E7